MNSELITPMTTKLEFIKGFYPSEIDNEGEFIWLDNIAEISIDRTKGVIELSGVGSFDGFVEISTEQVRFTLPIKKGEDKKICIPIDANSEAGKVIIQFSNYLEAPGDSRKLSFKMRKLLVDELVEKPKASEKQQIGVSAGQKISSFSGGWLRMSVTQSDGALKLSGIISAPSWRLDDIVLTVNGAQISGVQYHLHNPDYDFLGQVAFEGALELSQFENEHVLRFSTVYVSDGSRAITNLQDWLYPLNDNSYALPSGSNMKRIGSSEKDWFLFSGASFVYKLDDILNIFGSCQTKTRVLDWGCGCGRLSRHLMQAGYEVMGVDIDPVNIEWCKSNLKDSCFQLVSPDLPTQLESENFDLVVGHSVFTHLTEVDQFLWLAEINRVLRPDGLAVVTIMGNYSASIESFDKSEYLKLMEYGFLDVGWQEDGVDSQKPGFYRRIFHSLDYIVDKWANFLEVVSVVEGYSDHQAAIVLRKRKS